ncbi:gephyrin-like molybdotransferase Glp [Asticcacaulis sp. EMRT-3]|uniref:molybdopterin molybdotransferase MoeA n=1 Tax=Asticcacaulis sp. EMRT-3 TaxID=3040349 RepID=UPI0024AEABB9|nr:gephyrin-like molybdotransferase Glp [Asticcacaulis sp. EMRT-3]MDI7775612.1 molybdopterin molybdotransferase MoeA [Asticcacaulis sp. EMRT-3]
MGQMLTIDEAIDLVRKAAPLMPEQEVALHKAAGRVLAAQVLARRDQPPFAASAMDGYAVVADSLTPDIPLLRLIGESQAGQRFSGKVGVGEAVRIFTGAPVPEGADTIVIQENTERHDDWLTILPDGRTTAPRHIRPAGQDFRAGEALLETGLRLDGWRLALVAAAGLAEVAVRRRPEVVILCTGNELVQPGETPRPDQIFESGSHALMALITAWGGKASFVGVAGDHLKGLHKALKKIIKEDAPDLIVTVGGASVGDLDLVRPALDKLGLERAFDSVKARPGKPTSFGQLAGGTAVLSLPGNPASALVMAQLLLKTWLEAALGMKAGPQFVSAVLQGPVSAAGPRETFLRGSLTSSLQGQLQVRAFADQDSSLVSVFAQADALIRLPANTPPMSAGARVEVLPLERL